MTFSIANYYDASFAGVSFWLQDDGPFSSPGAELEEDFALLRIPGGNTTVLQSFGTLARQVTLPIAIDGSDLPALVAKHKTNGTLIYNGNTVSARLVAISVPQRDNLGHTTWKMTLKFILL